MRERLLQRSKLNRYDRFKSSFYEKVQKGFLQIIKKKPNKYMKIDSNLSIIDNENIIIDKIDKLTRT